MASCAVATAQDAILPVRLEQNLPGQLQLPRRSQVSNREPRRRDLSEARGCISARRLPEARMVEYVERIQPQLQRDALRDLRVLLKRNIHVRESRSIDRIARQVSESHNVPAAFEVFSKTQDEVERGRRADVGRCNPANVAVRQRSFALHHRAAKVWPDEVRNSRVGRGIVHVDRITCLPLHDTRQPESLHQAIALERQIVDGVARDAVLRIEVRRSIVRSRIVAVRKYVAALRSQRIQVHRLRIRVRRVELHSMREVLLERQPQRVVVRRSDAALLRNIRVRRLRSVQSGWSMRSSGAAAARFPVAD